MAAGRIILPVMPALDRNGNTVSGAQLFFYADGTTTHRAVYTSADLLTPHPQPVVADSAGAFPAIWGDTADLYSVVCLSPDGVMLPRASYEDVQPTEALLEGPQGERGTTGAPGGNVMSAGLFVDAEGLDVPEGTDAIRTSGHSVVGRGAAWFSTRLTGSPYAVTFTAADGRVFEMLPELTGWNLCAFGMLPGEGADETANRIAHQQAVDHALWLVEDGQSTQRLCFEPGFYYVDGAIKVFIYHADVEEFWFISIEITAPARGYGGVQTTCIRNTRDDQPCYIVQSARSVKFSNFSIRGSNINYSPTYEELVGDPDEWANQAGMRDRPHSPACGIVVDPFGSYYTGDDFYPDLEEFYTYNLRGSSATVIENMECQGFPVGILLSPSMDTQNDDSVMIRDCDLSYNTVALAVCQSQNRAVRMENCRVHAVHVVIDCISYGNGQGAFPLARDLNVTLAKYLFNGDSGISRGKIINWDVETTLSLGYWGPGGFVFDIEGCQMKLLPPIISRPPEGQGPNIDYHLFNVGPVNFFGGAISFYSNEEFPVPLSIGGGGAVSFHGTQLDRPVVACFPEQIHYENTPLRFVTGGSNYPVGTILVSSAESALASSDTRMAAGEMVQTEFRTYRNDSGAVTVFLDFSVTITVAGDGSATFPTSNEGKYMVGEWISTAQSWNTKSPSGATISLPAWASIGRVSSIEDGVVTLQNVPISFPTGVYHTAVQTLRAFRRRCVGTSTSASNVLTDVSPDNHGFRIGDRLLEDAGVPSGAYVTAVDTTAHTITMSLPSEATGRTRIRTADLQLVDAPATSAPTGVAFVGDFFRNTAPTVDVNQMVLRGWVAVDHADPPTMAPQYVSTVSPAT